MTPPTAGVPQPALADLLRRVHELAGRADGPVLIGIAGAPGSGKSTLTAELVQALVPPGADPRAGTPVAHVPVDGFHLADAELVRLGRTARKGAPDTFDVAGYAALLRRVRAGESLVYAPAFERELEQPLAGALPVPAGVQVVITEGSYLLLDDPGWAQARALLDEVWFVEVAPERRRERLRARHERFGKSPTAARDWVAGVDERNAELVVASRPRADLVIELP
ncbi:MAG: nucleoside/nucleotide kinase family protein [Mycobacteriaceae bacterium]